MANAPQPDLSEFVGLSSPRIRECSVKTVLETLKKAEREQAQAALAMTHEITHVAIAEWMKRRGHKLAPQTVARHRAGRCSCG